MDIFASTGNAQLKLFVARYPHFSGFRRRLLEMHSRKGGGLLCQPTLDSDPAVVRKIKTKPPKFGAFWWSLIGVQAHGGPSWQKCKCRVPRQCW
jgi:hypothetical protein